METILYSKRPRERSGKVSERQVGFYLRVSTEEQAENPEGSIKNQEERLKMTLELKNSHGPFGKLVGVYCDIGRSGKDMNRPELRKLLKAIESGEVTMVMVSELSRLSRSMADFSQIWEFMRAHGCAFLSLRDNYDTSSAAGEMMLYSMANNAQYERRQTGERVAAGFLSRARRGLWNGGVLPVGYEPDPNQRGSLRIVESEAQVVQLAFQALLKYGSVSEAAKWLNQNGHTYTAPLRGGGYRPRNRHFTFDSLYRLLSNPIYAGRRVVRIKDGKSETVQAVWPAMIEPVTFDRVQSLLTSGKKQRTGRSSRYPYLLTTRIYCGECGCALIGISAHGKTTKVPYYGHGVQVKREQALEEKSHRCDPFRVSGKKLEERIWKEILNLIASPSHRAPLFQALQALSEQRPHQRETMKKEVELQASGSKLQNLVQRVAELPAGVPATAFYDEMKRLGELQNKLKAELQEAKNRGEEQRLASKAEYDRLFGKLRERAQDVSPDSKRRMIRALIQKVVITKSGFDMYFYAGMDQVKAGEEIASPAISLDKKICVQSSFKSLNGGPTKNRTWN